MTTCSACLNLHQCRWLLRRTGDETGCHYEPSWFKPKTLPIVKIEQAITARAEARGARR